MRVDWQKAWLSCKEGVHSRGEPQCAQVKHRKKTPWTLHSYQHIQRCKSSTSAIYFLYIYFFTSLLLYVWHLSVKYFYMDNFLYFYSFTSLLLYVCLNKIFLYRPNMRTRKLENLVFDHFYFIKKYTFLKQYQDLVLILNYWSCLHIHVNTDVINYVRKL